MSKMIAYFIDQNDAWMPMYHQIKQFKKNGMDLEEMAEMKIYMGLDRYTEEPIFLTFVSDNHLLNQKMNQLWRIEYLKAVDKKELESADEEDFSTDEYVEMFESMMKISGITFTEEEVKDKPVIINSLHQVDRNIDVSKNKFMDFLPSQKLYVIETDAYEIEDFIQAVIQEEKLRKLFQN